MPEFQSFGSSLGKKAIFDNSSTSDYSYIRLFLNSEVVVQKYSVKKLFLKISQNSQENTSAGVSF